MLFFDSSTRAFENFRALSWDGAQCRRLARSWLTLPHSYARLLAVRELDPGGLKGGRVCLSLIQSGAALGEKRVTLAGEPEGRPGATLHLLDIAAGEKPLQVASFIARKRGRCQARGRRSAGPQSRRAHIDWAIFAKPAWPARAARPWFADHASNRHLAPCFE